MRELSYFQCTSMIVIRAGRSNIEQYQKKSIERQKISIERQQKSVIQLKINLLLYLQWELLMNGIIFVPWYNVGPYRPNPASLQVVDVSGAAVIADVLPGCRVDLLENCGHSVVMERPCRTAKLLLEFIILQQGARGGTKKSTWTKDFKTIHLLPRRVLLTRDVHTHTCVDTLITHTKAVIQLRAPQFLRCWNKSCVM